MKSPKGKKTKEPKTKESKTKDAEAEAVPYEVRMKAVTVISKPMADEKKVCVVGQASAIAVWECVGFAGVVTEW